MVSGRAWAGKAATLGPTSEEVNIGRVVEEEEEGKRLAVNPRRAAAAEMLDLILLLLLLVQLLALLVGFCGMCWLSLGG